MAIRWPFRNPFRRQEHAIQQPASSAPIERISNVYWASSTTGTSLDSAEVQRIYLSLTQLQNVAYITTSNSTFRGTFIGYNAEPANKEKFSWLQ